MSNEYISDAYGHHLTELALALGEGLSETESGVLGTGVLGARRVTPESPWELFSGFRPHFRDSTQILPLDDQVSQRVSDILTLFSIDPDCGSHLLIGVFGLITTQGLACLPILVGDETQVQSCEAHAGEATCLTQPELEMIDGFIDSGFHSLVVEGALHV